MLPKLMYMLPLLLGICCFQASDGFSNQVLSTTTSPPVLDVNCTFHKTLCNWINVDNKFKVSDGGLSILSSETGYLYSPTITGDIQERCLKLNFKEGDTRTEIMIFVEEYGQSRVVYDNKAVYKDYSIFVDVKVHSNFKIQIELRNKLLLEKVELSNNPCVETAEKCGFEEAGNCQWPHSYYSHWKPIKAINTMAQIDHTTGTENGHFLSWSTSDKDCSYFHESIKSPYFNFTSKSCVTFWLFMNDKDNIALRIGLKEHDPFKNHPRILIEFTDDYSWKKVSVDVSISSYAITFEARGNKRSHFCHGFIAIDDIFVLDGACSPQNNFQATTPHTDLTTDVSPDACGSPPQKDGIFSLEDETVDKFPVGTEVDYSCKTGYFKRSGVGKATCIVRDGKEVWDGPTLECSLVSCPIPERIDNGRIIGTLYKFGSKLTYECNPGYERSSTKIEKYCHATGNWGRGEFKCNPVKCPDVIDPKDGLATFTSTTFGSSVRFSCISPLVLKGSPLRVCTEDKTWSGTQPTCEDNFEATTPHTTDTSPVLDVNCTFHKTLCNWINVDNKFKVSDGGLSTLRSETGYLYSPTISGDIHERCLKLNFKEGDPGTEVMIFVEEYGQSRVVYDNKIVYKEYSIFVDVKVHSNFKILIELKNEFLLEKVELSNYPCVETAKKCGFEESGNCQWPHFYHSKWKPIKAIHTIAQKDHTTGTENGHFLSWSTSNRNCDYEGEIIASPFFNFKSASCVKFWLFMNNMDQITLRAGFKEYSPPKYHSLMLLKGTRNPHWKQISMDINETSYAAYFKVHGTKKGSFCNGFVAIDDISVQEGLCQSQNNFEATTLHTDLTTNVSPDNFEATTLHTDLTTNVSPDNFEATTLHTDLTTNVSPDNFEVTTPHTDITTNVSPVLDVNCTFHKTLCNWINVDNKFKVSDGGLSISYDVTGYLYSPTISGDIQERCLKMTFKQGDPLTEVMIFVEEYGQSRVVYDNKAVYKEYSIFVDVKVHSNFKILIELKNELLLEKVELSNYPCVETAKKCGFEEAGNCHWSHYYDSDWKPTKAIHTIAQKDHTTGTQNGHFLSWSSDKHCDYFNEIISSPYFNYTSTSCVKLWLFINDKDNIALQIGTQEYDSYKYHPLLLINGTSDYSWREIYMNVSDSSYAIYFKVLGKMKSYICQGFVAIDDIFVLDGACPTQNNLEATTLHTDLTTNVSPDLTTNASPVMNPDCTFQNTLCGWINMDNKFIVSDKGLSIHDGDTGFLYSPTISGDIHERCLKVTFEEGDPGTEILIFVEEYGQSRIVYDNKVVYKDYSIFIDIMVHSDFKIRMELKNHLVLDKVELSMKPCVETAKKCGFEEAGNCQWPYLYYSSWKRIEAIDTLAEKDHTTGTESGHFLSWSSSEKNCHYISQKIYSPNFNFTSTSCIKFWLFMNDKDNITLHVGFKEPSRYKLHPLLNINSINDLSWKEMYMNVSETFYAAYFIVSGVKTDKYCNGFVAIDDISVMEGVCPTQNNFQATTPRTDITTDTSPVMNPDCTFYNKLCNWINVDNKFKVSDEGLRLLYRNTGYLYSPTISGDIHERCLTVTFDKGNTETEIMIFVEEYGQSRIVYDNKAVYKDYSMFVDITVHSDFKIRMELKNHLVLGKVELSTKPCVETAKKCGFEEAGNCQWPHHYYSSWKRIQAIDTLAEKDHTTGTERGHFLSWSSSEKDCHYMSQKIISPNFNFTSTSCMKFWLFMNDKDNITLHVGFKELSIYKFHPLLNINGINDLSWKEMYMNVSETFYAAYFRVSGVKTGEYCNGFVAIDDISVMEGVCPTQNSHSTIHPHITKVLPESHSTIQPHITKVIPGSSKTTPPSIIDTSPDHSFRSSIKPAISTKMIPEMKTPSPSPRDSSNKAARDAETPSHKDAGTIVGIVIGVILVVGIAILGIFLYRKYFIPYRTRHSMTVKSTHNFPNPLFEAESSNSNMHIRMGSINREDDLQGELFS